MSSVRDRVCTALRFVGASLTLFPAVISFYWLWSM